MTHFFIRINSVLERFDSTQLMTHNGFTRIYSNHLMTQNGSLKFDSNQIMTQKASKYFDSNQLTNQKSFQNFDSNQLIKQKTLKYWVMTQWIDSTVDFVDLFWASTKFSWPFWAFISRRLESIQHMTQAAFQELTQNQLMTQVDSSGIDSDWLMTQSASPFFRFKSTHDSSEKHLTLSRLMIRLWVMPMSAWLMHHRKKTAYFSRRPMHQESSYDWPSRWILKRGIGRLRLIKNIVTSPPNIFTQISLFSLRTSKQYQFCISSLTKY